MEMHDAWFFIAVFVFIFLVWVATGGPLHPIAFTGPRLAQPGALGGGTYLQLPHALYGIGTTDYSLPGSSNTAGANAPAPAPSTIGGSVFGPSSPYRGVISMSHAIYGAGSSDPNNEYVEFFVPQGTSVPLDITGWRLSSDTTGAAAMIPRGTEVPSSGVINAAQDIVLAPGDRAMILSGRSPIGESFKENKCVGYFSTFQKFSPSLPQNCPLPSDELTSFYGNGYMRDSACIDYVNKISRCQVVLSPPPGLSGTCQALLVKYLNYNGCVEAHKNDPDFSGSTWRIYLGRTTSLWRTQHEVVKLTDLNGKTVDVFSY